MIERPAALSKTARARWVASEDKKLKWVKAKVVRVLFICFLFGSASSTLNSNGNSNATQRNTTQRNTTQHNAAQCNTTQHNGRDTTQHCQPCPRLARFSSALVGTTVVRWQFQYYNITIRRLARFLRCTQGVVRAAASKKNKLDKFAADS